MRVALLPSAYAPAVGGVEELTYRLALQLSACGHDVEVWTNRHPADLPATEVIEGLIVRRFTLPLPTASPGKALRFVPSATRALVQTARATHAFSPDVLHVQCFSGNGVYASVLSALLRVPLIISLQGETVMDDSDIYERSVSLRLGLRMGMRLASLVTACSQFVLDDAVQRFGLWPPKGTVIPNGVELDESPAAEGMELPFERYVLAVGRVVDKKGFDLLLDAFAQVAASQHDVGLVIGGDGPARSALLARAATLGIAGRVMLPGVLSRDQVARLMRGASAFVLPSRIEPFGIVVLEALRASRPVIVSSHGGAAEIVTDGEHGLVVDPLDTSAMASAIARLLRDRSFADRLGTAGRVRAEQFSWQQIARRYIRVYEDAVGDRNGRRLGIGT